MASLLPGMQSHILLFRRVLYWTVNCFFRIQWMSYSKWRVWQVEELWCNSNTTLDTLLCSATWWLTCSIHGTWFRWQLITHVALGSLYRNVLVKQTCLGDVLIRFSCAENKRALALKRLWNFPAYGTNLNVGNAYFRQDIFKLPLIWQHDRHYLYNNGNILSTAVRYWGICGFAGVGENRHAVHRRNPTKLWWQWGRAVSVAVKDS